jgi:hypothetical protein
MTGLKISAGHSLDIPWVTFHYPHIDPRFIGDF